MKQLARGVLLVAAGCSYDWSVAPEPVDGGREESEADAAASEPDAAVDAAKPAVDASRSCDAVLAELPAARKAAKACPTLTAACEREITDECGCRSFLWQGSGAAAGYEALVAESAALGCVPAGCNCLAGAGSCLAAGGGAYACSP